MQNTEPSESERPKLELIQGGLSTEIAATSRIRNEVEGYRAAIGLPGFVFVENLPPSDEAALEKQKASLERTYGRENVQFARIALDEQTGETIPGGSSFYRRFDAEPLPTWRRLGRLVGETFQKRGPLG